MAIALTVGWLAAIPQASARAATASTPEIRASLLTCAPGRNVYQLEGHTALRLTSEGDSLREPYDIVVNWGVFDFASPNFLWRFVKGETDYMALAYTFDSFMEEYRLEGREVNEQLLRLTPEQAARLEALVAGNILPENRTYRYNYVRDNCATRPLALVEAAMGDTLTFVPPSGDDVTAVTFRSEMRRYHRNYPWYQFGIDVALGSGIDVPVTTRQRTFAPVFLRDELENATYIAPDGTAHPIVERTRQINHGITGGVTAGPTPWPLTPVGVSVMLLVVTAAVSISDLRRRRLTRWFDSALYGLFFVAGCLLTFLIFISEHEATSPNWLYLWLNPFCGIAAAGVWIKRCRRAVYCYQICNFAALTVLLAGHGLLGQAFNAAFPLLILCDMMRSATCLWLWRPGNTHAPEDAKRMEGTVSSKRRKRAEGVSNPGGGKNRKK